MTIEATGKLRQEALSILHRKLILSYLRRVIGIEETNEASTPSWQLLELVVRLSHWGLNLQSRIWCVRLRGLGFANLENNGRPYP